MNYELILKNSIEQNNYEDLVKYLNQYSYISDYYCQNKELRSYLLSINDSIIKKEPNSFESELHYSKYDINELENIFKKYEDNIRVTSFTLSNVIGRKDDYLDKLLSLMNYNIEQVYNEYNLMCIYADLNIYSMYDANILFDKYGKYIKFRITQSNYKQFLNTAPLESIEKLNEALEKHNMLIPYISKSTMKHIHDSKKKLISKRINV